MPINEKGWLPENVTQGDLDDGDFAWLSDAYKKGDESKSAGRKLPYRIHGKVNEAGWKAAWSRAHSMADGDFDGGPSRTAVIAKLKRDKPSYAVRLARAQQQGMERVGAGDMPPYLVRAGEWVSIGDQLPLPIVQTSYDAFSEVLTVDCGDALPHGLTDMRTFARVAAHVTRGTNPTTGARA